VSCSAKCRPRQYGKAYSFGAETDRADIQRRLSRGLRMTIRAALAALPPEARGQLQVRLAIVPESQAIK
jgi:hypothetical protein